MKFELIEVSGLKGALIGMRLPMCKGLEEADTKSDSRVSGGGVFEEKITVGDSDKKLCQTLINADSGEKASGHGQPNSKFLRMIHVQISVTASLAFFKEFDTYKIATTSNSTSTMHRIHSYPITEDCFEKNPITEKISSVIHIDELEELRQKYNSTTDKVEKESLWYDLIYGIGDSWLQTRMIDLDYQTLRNMYFWRKNHKQITWRNFCKFIETLPESWLITE